MENDPRSGFFFSKKVKCHFCINLDSGYLLYVIVWIPKACSLLSNHSRVVFTISNGFLWTDTIIKKMFYYVQSEFTLKLK